MKLALSLIFICLLLLSQSCNDDGIQKDRQICETDFRSFPDIPGWQTTSLNIPPTDASISFIRFINDQTGFIFTRDGIWKTQNQGISWSHVFEKTDAWFLAVSFAGNSGFASIVLNKKCYILNSVDEGTTWHLHPVAAPALIKSLSFVDSSKGYANANGVLYESIDGGRRWIKNEILKIKYESKISIDTDGTGSINGLDSMIYLTMDYGESWKNILIPVGTATNVQIIDTNTIVVADWNKLFISVDQGSSWSNITMHSPIAYKFLNAREAITYQVRFTELDYDILRNCSFFLVTEDGGLTWKEGNETSSMHVFSIQMMTSDLGFLFTNLYNFRLVKIER